jgi:hypothetical protein
MILLPRHRLQKRHHSASGDKGWPIRLLLSDISVGVVVCR